MYDFVIWYSAILLGFIIPLQIICATQMSEPKMKENILFSSDFLFTNYNDWKLFDNIWKISIVVNIILVVGVIFLLFNVPPEVTGYIDENGNIYTSIPDGYYVEEEVQFEIIE